MGNASIPANSLNMAHFPSITGIAALAPTLPNPKTADPSEITATVFPFIVRSQTLLGSTAISRTGSATPGV